MIGDMRKRIANEKNVALFQIFSNKAIRSVCENLPGSKEALLNVKGFGKVKVKQYGDEVIELVKEYCDEKNIEPQFHISSDSPLKERREKESRTGVTTTVEQTLSLFKAGKSMNEIAQERNFAISTIEGHLSQAIARGLVSIGEFMPLDEVKTIAEYFPENLEAVQLSAIKEKAPADISYGKLKMVLAWLQKNKE